MLPKNRATSTRRKKCRQLGVQSAPRSDWELFFSLVCAFSRPFGVRFPVAFKIFKTAIDSGALSMIGQFHLDSFFVYESGTRPSHCRFF